MSRTPCGRPRAAPRRGSRAKTLGGLASWMAGALALSTLMLGPPAQASPSIAPDARDDLVVSRPGATLRVDVLKNDRHVAKNARVQILGPTYGVAVRVVHRGLRVRVPATAKPDDDYLIRYAVVEGHTRDSADVTVHIPGPGDVVYPNVFELPGPPVVTKIVCTPDGPNANFVDYYWTVTGGRYTNVGPGSEPDTKVDGGTFSGVSEIYLEVSLEHIRENPDHVTLVGVYQQLVAPLNWDGRDPRKVKVLFDYVNGPDAELDC